MAVAACAGPPPAAAGAPPHLPLAADWETDWSNRTIPLSDLGSGGPPRDGIPPIDRPDLWRADEAPLLPDEPVVAIVVGGEARAYPLRVLLWHEIANDTVGGVPVAVTFCPLCHSAVVFDRRISAEDGDRVLSFGVSGLLRNSDLVMWDRESQSLWQQFTGEGLVGTFAGRRLAVLAAGIVPWSEFRARHPEGSVLSTRTGHRRSYGANPYVGYADANRPHMFHGPTDRRLDPLARVVGVEIGGTARAYPLEEIRRRGRIEDRIANTTFVVRFHPGTRAALDAARIEASRPEGSGTVERADGTPLPHLDAFWFAWAAFHPETELWRSGG